MKFSRKIFFITFLIIITSFGAGGFFLINTVFTSTLNNRIDSAANSNRYVTTALSLYAENNSALASGNYGQLRNAAIGFAKQIAVGIPDIKITIGAFNDLSFLDDTSFIDDMKVNQRGNRIVHQNGRYYLQTISKIQFYQGNCYVETLDDITDVYLSRDKYCSMLQAVVVGVGLFASVLLVIFSKFLTRPLEKLTQASKQIASGNFDMRVKKSSGLASSTEINELSQNFNTMAEYVENYIEQLKQAAQSRDDFVADFTHELKTPLTSVIGYADMLRTYEMEPEKRRECAELIYKEGSRLEALSLNLLNLIVLKKGDIKTDCLNARIIAEETQKAVHFILERYGVKLDLEIEDALICAEPSLIKTLLYNLIDNACKASSAEQTVKLIGCTDADRYRFCVIDKGCGIPQEQLSRIIEPFYMVDKSRSRSMGGAGLGLSLCSEIAKLHGSELKIISIEGKGTSVSFTVPLPSKKESEVQE